MTSTNPSTPLTLNASLAFDSMSGAYTLQVKNTANADSNELSPALTTASVVTVVFRMSNSATDPKIAVSTGLISSWTVNKAVTPHEVTLVANPRPSSWAFKATPPLTEDEPPGGCTPSFCENGADFDYNALLFAAFDPLTALGNTDFTNKITGGFVATNGQYFDPRPNYNTTTKTLDIHVGSPHVKVDGVTLNTGFVRMFVPDAIITDLWANPSANPPDPLLQGSAALVTDPSLATAVVGGLSSGFSFKVEQLTIGGITGALFKIGEVTPFGYSTPDVAVSPKTSSAAPAPAPTPAPGPPPPPTPTAFPPKITAIANQVLAPGGSVSVNFTVSGDVSDAAIIKVGASAYDEVLLPRSAFRLTHGSGGAWTLTINAPAGRSGATVVQVMADDLYQSAGIAFVVTINSQATRSSSVTATSSGSGIALTWIAPTSGATVVRYAIAGGTTAGGANLPVIVTPDASTSYVIPMVPPGTYYFRVYPVFSNGIGLASDEVSVAAPGSINATGPPSALRATVNGRDVTLEWRPPAFGASPSLYEVEFGTTVGERDVAMVTAVNPTHTRRVNAGLYYMRVHGFNGGTIGAGSNEVTMPVDVGGCNAAPNAPVLLPVSITDGQATFSWLPSSASVSNYVIEIVKSDGSVITISTNGIGSSFVWTPTVASGTARVLATSSCGTSARSNEVSFVK